MGQSITRIVEGKEAVLQIPEGKPNPQQVEEFDPRAIWNFPELPILSAGCYLARLLTY